MSFLFSGNPQRLIALNAATRTPPTSFRVWAFGPVETTKGKFLFDKKAAASVMTEWRDWGNRLTFDYGHDATLGARGEDGKSAGSCNLELRGDGLWAVDVRWTAQAAQQLAAGEWLYFSPTFSHEKAGRIQSLVNIALTNIPATKGMTPLVAASQRKRTMTAEEALKKFRKAERIYSSCMIALAAASDDGDAETDTEEMKKAKAMKRASAKEKCAKAKLEYDSALRECEALGEDPMEASADDDDDDDDNDPPPPKSRPMPPKDTSRRQAPARRSGTVTLSAADSARIGERVLEMTGASTAAEALGKLGALSQVAENGGSDVAERIAQLEANVFKGQAATLMAEASRAGRLTPKAKVYAEKIADIEELTAYLETLPVVAATRGNGHVAQPDQKAASEITVATLSQDELEMCERLGTTPDAYAAQKRANAERRASSQRPVPLKLVRKPA